MTEDRRTECGIGNYWNGEFGLRPVGGIGAYAPEGMRNRKKRQRTLTWGRGNTFAKGIELRANNGLAEMTKNH
jgi:hypothetical protein